jgi:hypothetical protein
MPLLLKKRARGWSLRTKQSDSYDLRGLFQRMNYSHIVNLKS